MTCGRRTAQRETPIPIDLDGHPFTTTTAGSRPADSDKLDGTVLKVVAVVLLGVVMASLDMTVVNVALQALTLEFQTTSQDLGTPRGGNCPCSRAAAHWHRAVGESVWELTRRWPGLQRCCHVEGRPNRTLRLSGLCPDTGTVAVVAIVKTCGSRSFRAALS